MSCRKVVDRLIHVFVITISVRVPLNENQQQQQKNGTILDNTETGKIEPSSFISPCSHYAQAISLSRFCGCVITKPELYKGKLLCVRQAGSITLILVPKGESGRGLIFTDSKLQM